MQRNANQCKGFVKLDRHILRLSYDNLKEAYNMDKTYEEKTHITD